MDIIIHGINNKANEEQAGVYDEKKLITSEVRLSDNFSAAPGTYKLILRPAAVREIFNFIEWDVGWRSDPRVEQGGILLGKRYYDCKQEIHFVVVHKAITADDADGTTGYLDITRECWSIMHDKKDAYNKETGENAVIVGWFHTHPNMLPCFMSGTDRNTQSLFFDGENTYSIVINPQRHLLKAFRSKECYAVQAFLMLDGSCDTEDAYVDHNGHV
jgi:proteasome lid subunit RPN8/RPN11